VLPVLLFTHGAGWVFGDAHTHGRLVAELATRAGAAAVFTNYTLSPEAKYPTAIEQIYAVLEWVAAHGGEHQLDPGRIAVAGDSVGGNMTAAITIMAKQRGGPRIAAQVLYYPVTDANFDTGSYHQFATGYWLRRDAMQWYWDQYTTDPSSAPRSPRHRCAPPSKTSPGCRRRWSWSARPTRCATRARPTRRSCGRRGCP
jgi:acetyl esterase